MLQDTVETLKQTCFQGYPESAGCVQGSIDSRNSAIHSAYRISLRPSSLFEPRHPSLKVVIVVYVAPEEHQHSNKIRTGVMVRVLARAERERPRKDPNPPQPASREHRWPLPALPRPSLKRCTWIWMIRVNDPSAGSPTETLLRLLLPLSDKVH